MERLWNPKPNEKKRGTLDMATRRFELRVPEELHDRLKAQAATEYTSVSALLIRLAVAYLGTDPGSAGKPPTTT